MVSWYPSAPTLTAGTNCTTWRSDWERWLGEPGTRTSAEPHAAGRRLLAWRHEGQDRPRSVSGPGDQYEDDSHPEEKDRRHQRQPGPRAGPCPHALEVSRPSPSPVNERRDRPRSPRAWTAETIVRSR